MIRRIVITSLCTSQSNMDFNQLEMFCHNCIESPEIQREQ